MLFKILSVFVSLTSTLMNWTGSTINQNLGSMRVFVCVCMCGNAHEKVSWSTQFNLSQWKLIRYSFKLNPPTKLCLVTSNCSSFDPSKIPNPARRRAGKKEWLRKQTFSFQKLLSSSAGRACLPNGGSSSVLPTVLLPAHLTGNGLKHDDMEPCRGLRESS